MGRLPLAFAGRPITYRIPYTISGEVQLEQNVSGFQFPENTFIHNEDKPFEIHRVLIDCAAFTLVQDETAGTSSLIMFDPQPETCHQRFKLKIFEFSKSENLNKNPAFPSEMIWDNTKAWDWEDPFTLVRAEGFQVQVDTFSFDYRTFPTDTSPTDNLELSQIRIQVSFEGYKIVVASPSEVR